MNKNKYKEKQVAPFLSFILLLSAFSLYSCEKPPNLDATPKISFSNIEYVKSNRGGVLDSLNLFINIEDGDGDIGLDASDRTDDSEFRRSLYFDAVTGESRDSQGNFIEPDPLQDFSNVIVYGFIENSILTKTTTLDTLPIFDGNVINSCNVYEILSRSDSASRQYAVYRQPNPNSSNMFVKFSIKKGDTFEEFIRPDVACPLSTNVSFPRFIETNDAVVIDLKNPILEVNWDFLFGIDTVRIELFIKDRALNKSNTITTEFTLSEIRVN